MHVMCKKIPIISCVPIVVACVADVYINAATRTCGSCCSSATSTTCYGRWSLRGNRWSHGSFSQSTTANNYRLIIAFPGGLWSITMSVSNCMLAYLANHMAKLCQISYVHVLAVAMARSALMTLQCITCFRFCGWRHVSLHNVPWYMSCVFLNSKSPNG